MFCPKTLIHDAPRIQGSSKPPPQTIRSIATYNAFYESPTLLYGTNVHAFVESSFLALFQGGLLEEQSTNSYNVCV